MFEHKPSTRLIVILALFIGTVAFADTHGGVNGAEHAAEPPTATPTCTPPNIIVDGGFETGGIPSTTWNNPQSSTHFGTPVCNEATCGTGGGTAPPRTGGYWVWFGGIPLPETSTLGQNVTIPTGGASLRFWMRIGAVSDPFTDVLNVKIDNVTVQSYVEPSTAESAYSEHVVDLTSFANGAVHNIQFEYIGSTSGTASFVIDDVSLNAGPGCATPTATPTPTITPTPTPACTPAERVTDGTFEAGNPWTGWTVQTSTNFNTPNCNTALCGTDAGAAPPFAGDNWAWFGGIPMAETSTLGQNVTIPSGGPATLSFELRIGKVVSPFTDTLTVAIDNTIITTFTEPAAAEAGYTLRSFAVSAFADGGSHALLFTYTGSTSGQADFTVDNVSLIAGGPCTATISGTVTYGNAIGAPSPRFVSNVLISGTGSPSVSALTSFPDGSYSLSGFGAGAYTVTPSKTGGVNGISSFDAARIAQHAAGINPLTGNQLIVADVSGNGTISSFDAAQVARYAAAIGGSGATGNWIFMPVNRTYPSVTTNIAGEDFIALLMGEVSGNWTNTGARPDDHARLFADRKSRKSR